MYRLTLPLRRDHATRQWLRSPYRVHQRLCLMWPDGTTDPRMLWRSSRDGILVQSFTEPSLLARLDLAPGVTPILSGQPRLEEWEPEAHEGAEYSFDLLCSPSVVSLRWSGGFTDPANIGCWLGQKAAAIGLQFVHVEVGEATRLHLRELSRPERRESAAMAQARITGRGICRDAKALCEAQARGVGRGKAWGLGLLLVLQEGAERGASRSSRTAMQVMDRCIVLQADRP